MMEAELYLVLVIIIILWVMAFKKASSGGGSEGRNQFWFFLISSVAVVSLSFVVFVYPELDCKGFLCQLGPILIWIGLSALLLIVLPVILIVRWTRVLKAKEDNQQKKN